MKARAGTTLVEVLIAIFIMAIGLLALMTLFPLGALSMARAIQDDRVSQAGQQATAIAIAHDVRTDPYVTPGFTISPTNIPLPTNWDGPSYPVFADPWGMVIPGVAPFTTPTPFANAVYRTNLSFVSPTPTTSLIVTRRNALLWCGLQDELSFNPDGTLVTLSNATTSFVREPRTTWAYWLRRPNQSVPNVVELSVVVYSGRNLLSPSPTPDMAVPNGSFSATAPTSVSVPNTTDVRKGQWIVDVTSNPITSAAARQWGPVQGIWYRVGNVVDTSNGISLELQPTPLVAIQQLVVMEGVSDVFAKGAGRK